MTRERNRDRDRTKTREEWKRENEARVARGEEPIPESEMTRELDEADRDQARQPGQAFGHEQDHQRPEYKDAPPTPELEPGRGKGESHWNNPENVKNAIHYFENERPHEREQQQEHSASLEKEREEAAMRDGAENLEQKKPHRYDAGAALEKSEPTEQETTDNREDSRGEKPHRYDAGAAIDRIREEKAGQDKSEDRERDHDRDQWPER
jgi:hypothetical protein